MPQRQIQNRSSKHYYRGNETTRTFSIHLSIPRRGSLSVSSSPLAAPFVLSQEDKNNLDPIAITDPMNEFQPARTHRGKKNVVRNLYDTADASSDNPQQRQQQQQLRQASVSPVPRLPPQSSAASSQQTSAAATASSPFSAVRSAQAQQTVAASAAQGIRSVVRSAQAYYLTMNENAENVHEISFSSDEKPMTEASTDDDDESLYLESTAFPSPEPATVIINNTMDAGATPYLKLAAYEDVYAASFDGEETDESLLYNGSFVSSVQSFNEDDDIQSVSSAPRSTLPSGNSNTHQLMPSLLGNKDGEDDEEELDETLLPAWAKRVSPGGRQKKTMKPSLFGKKDDATNDDETLLPSWAKRVAPGSPDLMMDGDGGKKKNGFLPSFLSPPVVGTKASGAAVPTTAETQALTPFAGAEEEEDDDYRKDSVDAASSKHALFLSPNLPPDPSMALPRFGYQEATTGAVLLPDSSTGTDEEDVDDYNETGVVMANDPEVEEDTATTKEAAAPPRPHKNDPPNARDAHAAVFSNNRPAEDLLKLEQLLQKAQAEELKYHERLVLNQLVMKQALYEKKERQKNQTPEREDLEAIQVLQEQEEKNSLQTELDNEQQERTRAAEAAAAVEEEEQHRLREQEERKQREEIDAQWDKKRTVMREIRAKFVRPSGARNATKTKKNKNKQKKGAPHQTRNQTMKKNKKKNDHEVDRSNGGGDLTMKTLMQQSAHELLLPYDFIGNPSIPPLAPPPPLDEEYEKPSDEDRSPEVSYEDILMDEDLERGLCKSTTHNLGRNLLTKFARVSSSSLQAKDGTTTKQRKPPSIAKHNPNNPFNSPISNITKIITENSFPHRTTNTNTLVRYDARLPDTYIDEGMVSALETTALGGAEKTKNASPSFECYDPGYEGSNDRSFEDAYYESRFLQDGAEDPKADDDDSFFGHAETKTPQEGSGERLMKKKNQKRGSRWDTRRHRVLWVVMALIAGVVLIVAVGGIAYILSKTSTQKLKDEAAEVVVVPPSKNTSNSNTTQATSPEETAWEDSLSTTTVDDEPTIVVEVGLRCICRKSGTCKTETPNKVRVNATNYCSNGYVDCTIQLDGHLSCGRVAEAGETPADDVFDPTRIVSCKEGCTPHPLHESDDDGVIVDIVAAPDTAASSPPFSPPTVLRPVTPRDPTLAPTPRTTTVGAGGIDDGGNVIDINNVTISTGTTSASTSTSASSPEATATLTDITTDINNVTISNGTTSASTNTTASFSDISTDINNATSLNGTTSASAVSPEATQQNTDTMSTIQIEFQERLQALLQMQQFGGIGSPDFVFDVDTTNDASTMALLFMHEELAFLEEVKANSQVYGNVVVTTGFDYAAYTGQRIDLNKYDDEKLLQRFALLAVYFAATLIPPLDGDFPDRNSPDNDDDDAWSTIGSLSPTDEATTLTSNAVQFVPLSPGKRRLQFTQFYAIDGDIDPKFLVDECDWDGIECSRVVSVSVGENYNETTNSEKFAATSLRWDHRGDDDDNSSDNAFIGTISSALGLLSSLLSLDLSSNRLMGTIPKELYELTHLSELYLFKNELSGTVSSEIGNLDRLRRFHISHNRFTGTIPSEIKSDAGSENGIRPIQYFNIYDNKFTGTIPMDLRWRQCEYFDIGRNDMSGTLPVDIGDKFVQLKQLHLDNNNFSGTLPENYSTVGNGRLDTLSIDNNRLTGYVPNGDRELYDKLVQYTLHNNNFWSMDTLICDNNNMVEFKADCPNVCLCYGRYFRFCDTWCGYAPNRSPGFDSDPSNWRPPQPPPYQQRPANNWQQQQRPGWTPSRNNNWQQRPQRNPSF